MVDVVMWTMNNNYLKAIDRYGEWYVSVFLAAAGERFILLHDSRGEESIRNFFLETHELYTKYTLNPFYERNQIIQSGPFEVKVRLLAKRYLEK